MSNIKEANRRISECKKSGKTNLDLSRLELTEIPKSLSELTHLVKLDLSDNQIKKIEGLETCGNLECVELNCNYITNFPEQAEKYNFVIYGEDGQYS